MISLSFSQIDSVIGATLPASARKYPAFWAKGKYVGDLLARAGWRASLRQREGGIQFSRVGSLSPMAPRSVNDSLRHEPPRHQESQPRNPDLLLLGCVKTKADGRHAAGDLYTSTLFAGRKARVVATGAPWFVLSAKYGLVNPVTVIESYDETLLNKSTEERREWSRKVLLALSKEVPDLKGKTVEIHAGSEYRDYGLVTGLRQLGAMVSVPLEGLGIGRQLAWYASLPTSDRPPRAAAPVPEPSQHAGSTSSGRATEIARMVTADFANGKLNLADRAGAPDPGWEALPEFRAVRRLEAAGNSPDKVRLFLTFIAAMDRAREADRLWDAGATMVLSEPWTIVPDAVCTRTLTELRDALAGFGVSQRHSVDSSGWRLIAEAMLNQDAPGEVMRVIYIGEGDARTLVDSVRLTSPTGHQWFPLLSGPKISVMWVRMLAAPGGARIQRLSMLPVAVDVQVRKVSEYLGICHTAGQPLEAVRDIIQTAWQHAAESAIGPGGLGGTGAALDPAIWFFGKWGCTICERAGAKRPISQVCEYCRFGL